MQYKGKIKVGIVTNYSRAKTGFGQNCKNILRILHNDPDIEPIEYANGMPYGQDLRTPWKSIGTWPTNPQILQEIQNDPHKQRMAGYGDYMIEQIVKETKPDVIIGIEDPWAFDLAKKKFVGNVPFVLWTTIDSEPLLEHAKQVGAKSDKILVWASFAEKLYKDAGFDNVETLHGAIDYSSFRPLEEKEKLNLRDKFGLANQFVLGFVFKNQLRKSVPNLLEGFKLFKEKVPNSKLILHTDWKVDHNTWDIERYIREFKLDKNDILATYICRMCHEYMVKPYEGEEIGCPYCKNERSFVTKNNGFGVTEEQLNEIYNLMDVYVHPFTSGGQEMPIQEAKSAGLITLVTEYSCGLDCCYEEKGGLPLRWSPYFEPSTQFIKATTLPDSIVEQLWRVYNMEESEKRKFIEAGKRCIEDDFNIEKIVGRLKEIILTFGKCKWDFDYEDKECNLNYRPEDSLEDDEWLVDLYKGMFGKKLNKKDVEIQEGASLIKKDGREKVLEYLLNVGKQKNAELNKRELKLEDFFVGGEEEKRIAVVIPESAGDVLWVNSLIGNLKKLYQEYNIYVITKPEYFCMIDDNKDVAGLIPFKEGMDNLLFLEGRDSHNGYFNIAFLPAVGSQKFLNYMHNGEDRDGFNIMSDLDSIVGVDPYLQTR